MQTWDANTHRGNRPGTFHKQSRDWVRTGKALCGADISRSGWTTGLDHPAKHLKTCRHCERILAGPLSYKAEYERE